MVGGSRLGLVYSLLCCFLRQETLLRHIVSSLLPRVTLQWTSIPPGGVAILVVASYYRNRVRSGCVEVHLLMEIITIVINI